MSDAPSLVWGSTPLVDDHTEGRDWWIETSADGTNWGNPEAVVTQIKSHLQDGSLAQVTSDDNRQATIQVRVCAYDYEGLAQGEAALVAEANAPGYSTLTWAPNRLLAKPTVFDVVYATIAFDFDDLTEIKRAAGTILQRKYALTLECLPFGKDTVESTVTGSSTSVGAGPTTPVDSVINDGSSIAGWSSGNGSAVITNGDQVLFEPYQSGNSNVSLAIRNAVLTKSAGSFVYWDWYQSGTEGRTPVMIVAASGQPTTTISPIYTTTVQTPAGFTYNRSYFRVWNEAETFTTAQIAFGAMPTLSPAGVNHLYVDKVVQTTGVVSTGGGALKQRITTVRVGGSARTPARIEVTCPTSLGAYTLIYTRQAGSSFQPSLRPYANAPETPDQQSFSGGYSSYLQAQIPAVAVLQGTYNLVVAAKGTGTINYSVKMIRAAGSESSGDPTLSSQTQAGGTVAVTNDGIIDLGLFSLPPFGVSGNSRYRIQVALVGTGGVTLDEGWLFDVDRGALSIIQSSFLQTVEIRTADIQLPEPSYWGTYQTSEGNPGGEGGERIRIDSRVLASEHFFEAGFVDIFTACWNDSSSVKASFYRRHHTHATSIDA